MTEKAQAYNTVDFAVRIPDMSRLGDTLPARVGAPAPEFEARLLDGGTFRLADARGQRHVVLMTGAVTSPVCAEHVPALNQLAADFADRGIAVYLVYVRESHPAERFPHHTSMEQKCAHARELQRTENVQVPILVDDLEGTMHQAYGPWPAAMFVVHRDGRLVYRSTIADTRDVRGYLEKLVVADHLAEQPIRAPHVGYVEWIVEHEVSEPIHYRVYTAAGPKAFEDYWKVFPQHRDRWPGPPAGGDGGR